MEFDFVAFDMQRMWLGEGDLLFLLEIVVRVVIIFVYAVLLLRILDDKGMKDMSFLDYFIVIALGSAAGDPMFYPSVPLTYCLTVITVVIGLRYILTKLTVSNIFIQNIVQPQPVCIIDNGHIDIDKINKKNISIQTLYSELRLSGVKNLGQVEKCYLEPNGEISVFKFDLDNEREGLSILPPDDIKK